MTQIYAMILHFCNFISQDLKLFLQQRCIYYQVPQIMQLSQLLRKRRKELKLSTKQVADAIGKKQRAYEYYEDPKDPTSPDTETLIKLTKYLDFNLEDIEGNATKLHNYPGSATGREEEIVGQATLKMLFHEVAKLKANITGQDLAQVRDEMDQNTILLMQDILRGKG